MAQVFLTCAFQKGKVDLTIAYESGMAAQKESVAVSI